MKRMDFKNLDKKSKIEIAVTALLVFVLIIILTNSIRMISKSSSANRQQQQISPDTFQGIVKRELSLPSADQNKRDKDKKPLLRELRDDLPWGRDPFSKKIVLSRENIAISDISLEGILWEHGGEPSAILNGDMVIKGSRVGNFTVTSIEPGAVVLTNEKNSYKIKL